MSTIEDAPGGRSIHGPTHVSTGGVIDIYVKVRIDRFHSGIQRAASGTLFLKIYDPEAAKKAGK